MTSSSFPYPVLITGASSGIGLALTRLHLARGDRVIASSRQPDSSPLAALASRHDKLELVEADLTTNRGPASLADETVRRTEHLSRVICCAGVLHDTNRNMSPEKRLEELLPENLEYSFRLNALAPILLAQALLPLLRRQPATFAAISARVGSITDNHLGGWYSYRSSKAALNQLMRTFAVEARRRAPNLTVLALHPGTTDTPLSAPFQSRVQQEKLFSPDWVAEQLTEQLDKATPEQSGSFLNWRGESLPW
ncbi:SDR family NAD(P)-dependent oxidoreductase [Alcanivorax jadensis]|uniref:SDR family NAD(P)-dependent oxidoreductase n=1 Tax=Alcanivorax jadensis TaxID=64988 RepID=UPI00356AC51A